MEPACSGKLFASPKLAVLAPEQKRATLWTLALGFLDPCAADGLAVLEQNVTCTTTQRRHRDVLLRYARFAAKPGHYVRNWTSLDDAAAEFLDRLLLEGELLSLRTILYAALS